MEPERRCPDVGDGICIHSGKFQLFRKVIRRIKQALYTHSGFPVHILPCVVSVSLTYVFFIRSLL